MIFQARSSMSGLYVCHRSHRDEIFVGMFRIAYLYFLPTMVQAEMELGVSLKGGSCRFGATVVALSEGLAASQGEGVISSIAAKSVRPAQAAVPQSNNSIVAAPHLIPAQPIRANSSRDARILLNLCL